MLDSRRTSPRPIRCALTLSLLWGCAVPSADVRNVRPFDEDSFTSEVQPILAERCGNPSCHGRAERPLSIYSPLNWRADPEMTYAPTELDDGERLHNFTVSSVLASEGPSPDDTLLLRKALGENADTYHGGDVIFEGRGDRDYDTMLRWVQSGWPR